ncbi:MAG: hypothetical protein HQM10_07145 [Candidatus Riflebacteria bacterium]|nr:hypothetical protein [Candidatus Riflebacteria bacterium]
MNNKLSVYFVAVLIFVSCSASAQLSVPVSYDLGNGKKIDGTITGGSICDPEGFAFIPEKATATMIFSYESVDNISKLSIDPSGNVSAVISMKNGKSYKSISNVGDTEPIIVLQDESPDNGKTPGKARKFMKTGFRGIPLIEVDAALTPEVDFNAIKGLTQQFMKALDSENLDQAVEFHNKIGELLENNESTSVDGPESEVK